MALDDECSALRYWSESKISVSKVHEVIISEVTRRTFIGLQLQMASVEIERGRK